jgi:hypothetical protein
LIGFWLALLVMLLSSWALHRVTARLRKGSGLVGLLDHRGAGHDWRNRNGLVRRMGQASRTARIFSQSWQLPASLIWQ